MNIFISKYKLRVQVIFVKHVLLILFISFSGTFSILGQRIVKYDHYPQVYFDSIRAQVNDTIKENYTIRAYQLSEFEADEIIIDGHLDEKAWSYAERRGGFLKKEPYPRIPMSDETEFAILYVSELV